MKMYPLLALLGASLLGTMPLAPKAGAAEIGPSLQTTLESMQATDTTLVIISFDTVSGLQPQHLALLNGMGIATPATSQLPNLGMAVAKLTAAQIAALSNEPSVVSLWANDRLNFLNEQARILCGVDKLRADAALTAQNGGQVVDGSGVPDGQKPQFSVVVIDSGIDTTNPDLPFDQASSAAGMVPSTKVIQNVQVNTDSTDGALTFEEHQVNNDTVGHGTHCTGSVAGTGRFSRANAATTGPNGSTDPNDPAIGKFSDFSGVAGRVTGGNGANVGQDSGVKVIGCGSGAGLFILTALGGFEYSLDNQVRYNIRVTSNSYGSNGPFTPNSPLNLAIKEAYNRNITNVFAAGNDGPTVDTINNSSKSPFVITVAAGTKEGGLAGFSSRGKPAAERVAGTVDEFNFNAITAPGTGREFDFNAPGGSSGKGFTSDRVSTGSSLGTAAGGTGGRGGNDFEFPAPYQAAYTQISGTSMACPFIAGVVALLLDVDSTLTPDSKHPQANGRLGLKEIMQTTATNIPGLGDHEQGSGYVNVYAAVDKAFNMAKPYEPLRFRDPEDFVTQVLRTALPPSPRPAGYPPATVQRTGSRNDEQFDLPFTAERTPSSNRAQALMKASRFPTDNAYAFNVVADPATGKVPSEIDVRIAFGMTDATEDGNSLLLRLYTPSGQFINSSATLPILNSPSRQLLVKNPEVGLWVLEIRPLFRPVGGTPGAGALPDQTTGQIFRTNFSAEDPTDIEGITQAPAIRTALLNRFLDAFPGTGGTLFLPTAKVTRADFTKALALNTPLRQSLRSTTPRFVDVDSRTSRIAEAASQNGSTLRDFDFTPGPTLPVSASTNLGPNVAVSRSTVAVAMVRALGLDTEARNLRDIQQVTAEFPAGSGMRVPVSDIMPFNPAEPGANTQNGYFQLAINRGLMTIRSTGGTGGVPLRLFADPARPLVRADLATVVTNFRRIFSVGNSITADELPTGDPPEEP